MANNSLCRWINLDHQCTIKCHHLGSKVVPSCLLQEWWAVLPLMPNTRCLICNRNSSMNNFFNKIQPSMSRTLMKEWRFLILKMHFINCLVIMEKWLKSMLKRILEWEGKHLLWCMMKRPLSKQLVR
jgi:hypothetical protein